jgi:TonB family protein
MHDGHGRRSIRAAILAAAALLSTPAGAQAPAAPDPAAAKAPEKLRYVEGAMLVLVAPAYPKAALARGETATVRVAGTIQTDGRLEIDKVESRAPDDAFALAVREAAKLWRMQPRIVTPSCDAVEVRSEVTVWFEIVDGKPKVSYAVKGPPQGSPPPQIHKDRAPIRSIAPEYPAKLAFEPNTPKSIPQIAYIGVAESGDVINVTLAPLLYYREFEHLIALAIRQWKYEPQESRWCGETVFRMTLE